MVLYMSRKNHGMQGHAYFHSSSQQLSGQFHRLPEGGNHGLWFLLWPLKVLGVAWRESNFEGFLHSVAVGGFQRRLTHEWRSLSSGLCLEGSDPKSCFGLAHPPLVPRGQWWVMRTLFVDMFIQGSLKLPSVPSLSQR